MKNPSENSLEAQLNSLDAEVRLMLREDIPAQLQELDKCLNHGDIKAARDVVHTVNGSASFCRLESLRKSAESLEHALNNNNHNDLLVAEFKVTCKEVLSGLEVITTTG